MDITELKRQKKIDYQNRHPWEQCRARIILFLLLKYAASHNKDIADIGSGDGYLAHYLSRTPHFDRINCIDPALDPQLIDRISQQSDSRSVVFYQNLDDFIQNSLSSPSKVLLLDVLEHLDHPDSLLRLAADPLYRLTNATWIITVPAYQSLFSEHDDLLGHRRRYTRRSIGRLLKSSGFEIQKTGYFFFSLLFLRGLERIKEKLTGRKKTRGVDNWQGKPIFTNLLTRVLWLDFQIGYFFQKIGVRLPGLSCYTICKLKQ